MTDENQLDAHTRAELDALALKRAPPDSLFFAGAGCVRGRRRDRRRDRRCRCRPTLAVAAAPLAAAARRRSSLAAAVAACRHHCLTLLPSPALAPLPLLPPQPPPPLTRPLAPNSLLAASTWRRF